MKIEVTVKNKLSQVRSVPSIGGQIKTILNPSTTIYTAVKMRMGWYYLSELSAWIDSSDVLIKRIIEPYEPEDDYSIETNPIEKENEEDSKYYDPEKIVAAINKALAKIDCRQVVFKDSDKETPIYGLIRNLQQSLSSVDEAVAKMNRMPDIPALGVDARTGMALVISEDESQKLQWEFVQYPNVVERPEDDARYTNQF